MSENNIERRTCLRFEIPGATISYKFDKFIPSGSNNFTEEFCPILDISRGGLRFLSQKSYKINTKLLVKISVPGEQVPLQLKGRVRWAAANSGRSYKYQIGIQFNPYGEKKGQNYPGTLVKIIALEQKFCSNEENSGSKSSAGFEVDG